MKKIIWIIICLLTLLISACDHTKEVRTDFLGKANLFWKEAVSNNCENLIKMVRYPVLMDGMSIDSDEKLLGRCNAIYTSAKYLKEKKGISPADPAFIIYKSGWLKGKVLEDHPLLKQHIGNDISYFLLEVTSKEHKDQPASFVFRRDYDEKQGNWEIIMLEDYSLSDVMEKK